MQYNSCYKWFSKYTPTKTSSFCIGISNWFPEQKPSKLKYLEYKVNYQKYIRFSNELPLHLRLFVFVWFTLRLLDVGYF